MLAVAGLALSGAAFAAPATQEQIDAANEVLKTKMAELRAEKNLTAETYKAAALEALADIEIAELTSAQIGALDRAIYAAGLKDAAYARLTTLAADPTVDGAAAAALAATMTPDDAGDEAEVIAIRTAITHPALREALMEARGEELLSSLGWVKLEQLEQLQPEMRQLGSMINGQMPPEVVTNTRYLYNAYLKLGETNPALREEMRGRFLKASKEAAASASADEKVKLRLEKNAEYLAGAFARGELIGHEAPALTIEWSSDPAITSLADLKGKVVVLDFWATWCGPCIASFPNVRELVEHYEGYPVAVIGVTSIQGTHYGADGPVDCKDNPDQERSLMPSFMTEKEMTWPVVFAKQEVFNPEYGVNGIPHVAIIAPDGTVRFNAMHPASPLSAKTEKIDSLLKEFHLAAPAPVVDEESEDADH